eukprot:gene43724-691_t
MVVGQLQQRQGPSFGEARGALDAVADLYGALDNGPGGPPTAAAPPSAAARPPLRSRPLCRPVRRSSRPRAANEAAAPVLRGDGVKLLIGNEHRLGEKSAKDNSHLHGERWHMITLFVRLAPDQPADALKAILRVRFTAHQTVRGGNPDKDGGITEPNSADRRGFQKSMKLWGMFE